LGDPPEADAPTVIELLAQNDMGMMSGDEMGRFTNRPYMWWGFATLYLPTICYNPNTLSILFAAKGSVLR
jgi:hypothetical protein